MKLYVLGGRQRKLGVKEATAQDEWYLYDSALILEVDTESGAVRTLVEYQSPSNVTAGDRPAAHFHSGAVVNDVLYTCTTTEVLSYRIPSFEKLGYISLPCFNDLHHVTVSSDGHLLVVNTGLDMVLKLSHEGEILAEWSVLGEPPWSRFSRSVDYRKVATTKPHRSHPNFAFELGEDVWATRFHQKDAVALTTPNKRIDLAGECPHDGLVRGDFIYFTAVDGKILVVNRNTLQAEQSIDLRHIQDRDQKVLPAWCRGILPLDETRVWVGFTRIRRTLFRENVRWVKNLVQEGTVVKPTHIALFDLSAKRCLREINLEPYSLNTVFSIFTAST